MCLSVGKKGLIKLLSQVNQKLTLRLLQKLGYGTVEVANNGKEAVTAVMDPSKSFDLVLMDVQMPLMSGLEATRIIREDKDKVLKKQPVVLALTANAMERDRQICLENGMDGHISKPVKLETLAGMIERFTTGSTRQIHM